MKTHAQIREEHRAARRALVETLTEAGSPKDMRQLSRLARQEEYKHIPFATFRRAAWTLVDKDVFEFTTEHLLRFKE